MRPFAAAGHDPGPSRGRPHVGGIGGGDGNWWACWLDAFRLGRSLQCPPVLSIESPSRPSRRCIRVGPRRAQRGRPALPWRAAGRRIRVASEWRTGSGPTRPAGLAVAGRKPSYPSRVRRIRVASVCQRPASAAGSSVSSSWSTLFPSRLVLVSSVCWPSVGRLVTARSAGPRPQRPSLARLPSLSAPGSVLHERCYSRQPSAPSRPPVAPAVGVLAGAHRPSVAPAASTPNYAARRVSAAPAAAAHRSLFAPKVGARLR